MKKIFFLLAVLFSTALSAETYTIVFNSNENGDGNATDKLEALVYSATNNCVDSIIYARKVARAKPGFGIKGGTSGEKGELALRLDAKYHISTMTLYAAAFVPSDGKDTADTKRLVVYDKEIAWEKGHRAEIRPYTITLDKDLDSILIASKAKTANRWYVQKIEFEAENPNPTKGVLETPYIALTFEAVSWTSADEPMEDALDFEVFGKNINGTISIATKSKSSSFTVTPATLPSKGGEVGVAYSITMPSAPQTQKTIKDSVIVTAVGTNDEKVRRGLVVSVTIKPEGKGASTFNVDTTRMAIGPMPGYYYKFAQGTADSTLKNHLGAIICVGKRYRYGSGPKKTWDAFWYTDRNTETNEVLDMYSNEHRYFDPEKPTASVAGFDIEHMLPKSWWGGDVNPAYCDLYHLVPGDASANRSKSNHAPGIPTDSSFNNGSFVTGEDTNHNLKRAFCPADEYKGDFARAYFYIATCYGDSLTWLTTGEPAQAMTNEGWQEFQPWLRDLLVAWHRLDPVSNKEKARAIEVNKIQGNRNPFIDYPELVEYIWGNKRGTAVDFNELVQSYGDKYDEDAQPEPDPEPDPDPVDPEDPDDPGDEALDTPSSAVSVYKQFRDGQLVIIRNASIYTTLGQTIR